MPSHLRFPALLLLLLLFPVSLLTAATEPAPVWPATADAPAQYAAFPVPLREYNDAGQPLGERLAGRIRRDPFNLAATILFACAIAHTFLASTFNRLAHRVEERHRARIMAENEAGVKPSRDPDEVVSFPATMLHYLGEVEAVFATWVIPLIVAGILFHDWTGVEKFVGVDCDFREALFVVVVMAISASRPVVRFAESCLSLVAVRLLGGSPAAWWFTVLIIAPVLGSFITEPAAMTIGALLLLRRFYALQPPRAFAYATLGLLFVNISIGGVLTNFAAPPVLMVAARWEWSTPYMFLHFGWRAVIAILISTALYGWIFRRQLRALNAASPVLPAPGTGTGEDDSQEPVPPAITFVHLLFLAWTVFTGHYPALCIGGFLFFLAFTHATNNHQDALNLRGPLLVGFFLAGLVIHGRCQAWWLEPVLGMGLGEWPLLLGAAGLTAFNDNALITFLASQVPGLPENLRFAVMAGAVAGGGLTVIANAPNPAGQGILKERFGDGVSPLGLLAGALVPTLIAIAAFMVGRS